MICYDQTPLASASLRYVGVASARAREAEASTEAQVLPRRPMGRGPAASIVAGVPGGVNAADHDPLTFPYRPRRRSFSIAAHADRSISMSALIGSNVLLFAAD